MATIRQKVRRAEAATQRVEAFVAAGGVLKSAAAVPVAMEFMSAFAEVAKEFGYEIPKVAKKTDNPPER